MKQRSQTQTRSRSRHRSRGLRTRTRRGMRPAKSRSRTRTRSGAGRSSERRTTGRRRTGRNAKSKSTTDQREIQQWVESRGGHPAIVRRPGQSGGILRIDFPGFSGGRTLKPVSWEEWFEVFEHQELAFLHQDRTASGKPSRFNKLVSRS